MAPDLFIAQLEVRRETVKQAIETAHREAVEVLVNPSSAAVLFIKLYPMISHLLMNETEASNLSGYGLDEIQREIEWGKVAEFFKDLGVKNVVITLAENGAYY